jgi:hypothetical protein
MLVAVAVWFVVTVCAIASPAAAAGCAQTKPSGTARAITQGDALRRRGVKDVLMLDS